MIKCDICKNADSAYQTNDGKRYCLACKQNALKAAKTAHKIITFKRVKK